MWVYCVRKDPSKALHEQDLPHCMLPLHPILDKEYIASLFYIVVH
jgi:hypothetical protein